MNSVIVAVAWGGGPTVGLRSAPVGFYHRLPGVRTYVVEPGDSGVLADQCVVELVAVTVSRTPPRISGLACCAAPSTSLRPPATRRVRISPQFPHLTDAEHAGWRIGRAACLHG